MDKEKQKNIDDFAYVAESHYIMTLIRLYHEQAIAMMEANGIKYNPDMYQDYIYNNLYCNQDKNEKHNK